MTDETFLSVSKKSNNGNSGKDQDKGPTVSGEVTSSSVNNGRSLFSHHKAKSVSSTKRMASEAILITVAPFTGGPFTVKINQADSVEDLKKAVAKKLKVLKDRICLLYRERQLFDGSLKDNYLVDGSRVTLLPRAETGLLAQKPEQSVMQALESLNDSQVVDFLSGKAPLNLTMRLGDHMMLIQLQLSTNSLHGGIKRSRSTTHEQKATSSSSSSPSTSPSPAMAVSQSASSKPKLDTRALAEASKNLTQTLKQLSTEVLNTKKSTSSSSFSKKNVTAPTSKASTSEHQQQKQSSSSEERPHKRPRTSSGGRGAIIESMQHHGKGVYSGTFSGTLNPALQDRNGQPKRDITTIIHILNDLLCAQYKNYQTSDSLKSTLDSRKKGHQHDSMTSHKSNSSIPTRQPPSPPPPPPNEELQANKPQSLPEQIHVTKYKVKQLKRFMEERKAKRRARREARSAPYSTSWSVQSDPSENDAHQAERMRVAAADSENGSSVAAQSNSNNAAGDMFNSSEPETVVIA